MADKLQDMLTEAWSAVHTGWQGPHKDVFYSEYITILQELAEESDLLQQKLREGLQTLSTALSEVEQKLYD